MDFAEKTSLVDANVIIRYFLNDHPKLSLKAKSLFTKAQKGQLKIYLDEIVVAEVIWTLSSFYKIKKADLVDKLRMLIAQDWIVNPRKDLILEAIEAYASHNLAYIDCWLYVLSKSVGLNLETFDKELKKLKSLNTAGQIGKTLKKKQSPKR